MKRNVKRIAAGKNLTAAQRRKIAALAARPENEIDCSDIPRLQEKFWKNAARNPFYRPVKRQVTVRLDADIIAWLQAEGKGYQTRLNHLLRSTMLQELTGKS
jgi:uncharacterized protein (DUF4415 family)